MGILNVTVGNNLINRTSVGQSEGYQDLSCTQNAPLTVGQNYAISVRTNANGANENVRVWIDYNNDGEFTGNNELVLTSNNNTLHVGSFAPPAGAVLATRLRLRVAADYALLPPTTPFTSCSTPVYSQDEDYSVTLSANVSPPVAAFTTSSTFTCSGCVQFTDASQNFPTAWLWTFGDGSTSTLQNPNYCYTTAGTYSATLRATNAAGNTTSVATSITYNPVVPVAASCTTTTTNYFANYGITRFRLGTIDNTSADGSAGYQDFTCPQRTNLTVGTANLLAITTGGTNAHAIRVFLDLNNDGVFSTTERLYENLNAPSPGITANITIPGTTVLNQPLRLRVIADAVGSNPAPCTNQVSGQAEDYTVVMRPNTAPPVAAFSSNYVPGGCVNPIQFTDLSTNAPTSWLWNFGDGGTSTLQNPLYRYVAAGTYTVSLTATNANGPATTTVPAAVTVQVPCLVYCASNGFGGMGGGGNMPSPFWMTSVSVSNAQPAYTNASGNAPGGYFNYIGLPIALAASRTMNLTVVTNFPVAHRTSVWVDLNVNGTFDANELVANGLTNAGVNAGTFTATFTLPAPTAGLSTRMRVQVAANMNPPAACGVNILNAEVEDYQVIIGPLAAREALALPSLSLYPTPPLDGHVRLHLPDAAAAGLYGATVQNVLGATLLTTRLRLGPANDAELDLSALAPGVYVLKLRDAQGQTALRRVVRE